MTQPRGSCGHTTAELARMYASAAHQQSTHSIVTSRYTEYRPYDSKNGFSCKSPN
jgi:hypothetical protein